MKLLSIMLLLAVATSSCTFSISGNHRPVGKVDSAIADAQTIETLRVDNRAGTVTIRACEAASASIEAQVLLTEDRLATEFAAEFAKHVKVDRSGNQLTISSVHASATDAQDWQLRLVINVPAGLSVDVHQEAGAVDVKLPKAKDVTVNASAGTTTIAVDEVTGKVTADVEAGEITLSVPKAGPAGGCDLDCTAGTVTLSLAKGTSGMFDLRSTTGDVSIAKHYGLRSKRSVTTVTAKGKVGNGGPTIRAHTVTGVVTLR